MSNSNKHELEDVQLWRLPSVDDELKQQDLNTNALNRPKGRWKYEAPEQEEEVKPLTAKEIEAIRAAAYQEGLLSGHEEGYAKGHKEGIEKGQSEGVEQGKTEGYESGKLEAKTQIDEQLVLLTALIDASQEPIAKIEQEVKNELVVLAITLAQAVIRIDVTQNSEILVKAINEGIQTLPIGENIYQVSLHPEDKTLITELYGEQHISEHKWQLVEDSNLSRGGCRIQTTTNAVDVSIERRSEQVFSQLLLSQGLADDPRAS